MVLPILRFVFEVTTGNIYKLSTRFIDYLRIVLNFYLSYDKTAYFSSVLDLLIQIIIRSRNFGKFLIGRYLACPNLMNKFYILIQEFISAT